MVLVVFFQRSGRGAPRREQTLSAVCVRFQHDRVVSTLFLFEPNTFFCKNNLVSAAAAPPASAPAARCWRCRRPRRRPARPHSTRQRAVKMLRCRSPLVSLAPVGDREPPSRRVWCPPRPCCVCGRPLYRPLLQQRCRHTPVTVRARTTPGAATSSADELFAWTLVLAHLAVLRIIRQHTRAKTPTRWRRYF